MLRSSAKLLRLSLCIFLCFPGRGFYSIRHNSGQSEGGWEVSQPIRGEEADDTAISDIMTTVNIGHLPVMDSVFYGRKAQLPCIFCFYSSSLDVFVFYFLFDRKKNVHKEKLLLNVILVGHMSNDMRGTFNSKKNMLLLKQKSFFSRHLFIFLISQKLFLRQYICLFPGKKNPRIYERQYLQLAFSLRHHYHTFKKHLTLFN